MRASGAIWRYQASGRMLNQRFGVLSQYKNEKGCCTKFVASRNSLFLCLRETHTMEGTQKEHPVSAVKVTAHPLLLPPRLCLLVAVERMFLLPSLYHRGLGRQGKGSRTAREDMLCVHKKSLAMGASYPTAQSTGTIRPARLISLKYTEGGRYCQGVRERSVIIGI